MISKEEYAALREQIIAELKEEKRREAPKEIKKDEQNNPPNIGRAV